MEILKKDLAYMAGFFDGEGCVSYGSKTPAVSLSQTVEAPLLMFVKYFGGKIHVGSRITTGGLTMFVYRRGSREDRLALLSALYPYCSSKREKMKKALELLGGDATQEIQISVEERIPYIAGFFDAEGSITVRHMDGNKLCVNARIGQNVIHPLELIKEIFGGKLKAVHTPKGTPSWHMFFNTTQSNELLHKILPFLIVKKKQAELALKIRSIHLSNWGEDPRAEEKWLLAKELISLNSKKGNHETCRVLNFKGGAVNRGKRFIGCKKELPPELQVAWGCL